MFKCKHCGTINWRLIYNILMNLILYAFMYIISHLRPFGIQGAIMFCLINAIGGFIILTINIFALDNLKECGEI